MANGIWTDGTSDPPAGGTPLWGGNPYKGDKGDKGDKGVVQEIIAGANITVDNTNPASPVIASTATGASWNLEQW